MHTISTTSTSAAAHRVRETPGKSHVSLFVTASVLAILASTLIAIVSGRTEPVAATAPPLATPSGVTVAFTKSLAEIKWGAVPGATSYRVSIAKAGYFGPWVGYKAKGTSLNIAYTSLPYRHAVGGGYRFEITAFAKGRSSKTASKTYRVSSTGERLKITSSSQKMRDKIVKKAKSCLKDGKAAIVGATLTAGALAVATSWIPGVDAVTAGAAALAIAADGVGTYLGCAIS